MRRTRRISIVKRFLRKSLRSVFDEKIGTPVDPAMLSSGAHQFVRFFVDGIANQTRREIGKNFRAAGFPCTQSFAFRLPGFGHPSTLGFAVGTGARKPPRRTEILKRHFEFRFGRLQRGEKRGEFGVVSIRQAKGVPTASFDFDKRVAVRMR